MALATCIIEAMVGSVANEPDSQESESAGVLAATPVLTRMKGAAKELGDALSSVLDEIPDAGATPQGLTQKLGINRALAGRLLSALKLSDPLASVIRMPRSEGLRIFLSAAKSHAARPRIERANRALRGFEDLLRVELGGWAGLEPVISEWLPDVRSKFEMTNKQGAFRCLSNLRGVQADVELASAIYYPADSGQHCDVAMICGMAGLRRLRPSTRICFVSLGGTVAQGPLYQCVSVEGVGGVDRNEFPLLNDFCSSPLPKIQVEHVGKTTNYMLEGSELGPDSSMDLYVARVVRRQHPRYQTDPPRRIGPISGVTVPAKTLIVDLFIHEDLCPGRNPELVIYDTVRGGHVDPNDPSREVDRLYMAESILSLGTGVARFRASEVAHLAEMTAFVCQKLGWDAERLRGYRCRVRYPIYGAQYCLLLNPPPASDS